MLVFLFASCGGNGNSDQQFFFELPRENTCTLYVHHEEATGSADVYIDSGNLEISPDKQVIFTANKVDTNQLKLRGEFDFDQIDNTSFWFDPKKNSFRLIGRIVGFSSSPFYGKVPILEVEQCEASTNIDSL